MSVLKNMGASFGIGTGLTGAGIALGSRGVFGAESAAHTYATGAVDAEGNPMSVGDSFAKGALPEYEFGSRIAEKGISGLQPSDALFALYFLNLKFDPKGTYRDSKGNLRNSRNNPRGQRPGSFAKDLKKSGANGKVYEDKTMAGKAKSWQGKPPYNGVDDWNNITLKKGDKIVGGIPGQSEFYTTIEGLQKAGGNKGKLWKGLQVQENKKYGYRKEVAVYEVIENTPAASSKTSANPQFGKGGLDQIYVEDFKNKLKVIDVIVLK